MIHSFSHFACPQSPNALLHAPLMHLTPCYISFPLRYSIAPANKILGKTAPIPGAATAASFVFFCFFRFGASSVLTRSNNTQHWRSRFSYCGRRFCFQSVSFKGASSAKNDSTIPSRCRILLRTVVASCILLPAFLRCTYAFRY
jgi:hypothetical protein